MLGSFYSGYCWDKIGGDLVFVIAALACGLAWIIAFIGVARQKPVTLS
jgi:PPP family 3-phenylpropionic acid transporter